MRDIAPFFRSWLSKRREIASVIPSSRWAVRTICKRVSSDARQVIVEFGPGTGPLTRGLLKDGVLTPDSSIILIETNPDLVRYLRTHIDDPRVSIIQDTAENVRSILADHDIDAADAVISGIPYSYFSETTRDKIVEATADVLKPNGTHLVYQVRKAVEPALQTHFTSVRRQRVWPNIPPLHLFEAKIDEKKN